MTSITKIAKYLQIAPSTVSRALKKPQLVSLQTRDRVLKAAEQMGYLKQLRDSVSVANVTESNRLIGVLVADLTTTFSNKIVKAIHDYLDEHDYAAIVGCHYEKASIESRLLKQWSSFNLEGLIVMPTSRFSQTLSSAYANTPIVMVDRNDTSNLRCDSVTEDNHYGIEQAIDYLLELGHERILLISGSENVFTFKERVEAAKSHYPKIEVVELDAHSYDELFIGAFEATNLVTMPSNDKVTAIIGANNAITSGVLYALNLKQVKLAKDISIISYGDNPWCRFFPTPITAIVQPTEEMGRVAAKTLIERINGKTDAPIHHCLKSMLLRRASTSVATKN